MIVTDFQQKTNKSINHADNVEMLLYKPYESLDLRLSEETQTKNP